MAHDYLQTQLTRFFISSILASQELAENLLADFSGVEVSEHLQGVQACMVAVQRSHSDCVSYVSFMRGSVSNRLIRYCVAGDFSTIDQVVYERFVCRILFAGYADKRDASGMSRHLLRVPDGGTLYADGLRVNRLTLKYSNLEAWISLRHPPKTH